MRKVIQVVLFLMVSPLWSGESFQFSDLPDDPIYIFGRFANRPVFRCQDISFYSGFFGYRPSLLKRLDASRSSGLISANNHFIALPFFVYPLFMIPPIMNVVGSQRLYEAFAEWNNGYLLFYEHMRDEQAENMVEINLSIMHPRFFLNGERYSCGFFGYDRDFLGAISDDNNREILEYSSKSGRIAGGMVICSLICIAGTIITPVTVSQVAPELSGEGWYYPLMCAPFLVGAWVFDLAAGFKYQHARDAAVRGVAAWNGGMIPYRYSRR